MPRTLLVVDDSATICQAVRHALTGEDWTVVTASNPSGALELLRTRAPDAVLCDVSLADADGYEVCRSIRTASGNDGPPVILMGAKVSDAGAKAAGASASLPKPFESSELVDALQSALDQGELELSLGDLRDFPEVLTLEPTEAVPLGQPSAGFEEVDIIDLSGDDEYTDLEVIEGLDPIELLTAERPSFGSPSPGFAPDEGGAFARAAEPIRFGAPSPSRPIEELEFDRDVEGPLAGKGAAAAPSGKTQGLQGQEPFERPAADFLELDLEEEGAAFPEAEEAAGRPSVRLGRAGESLGGTHLEDTSAASGEFSFDALEFDRRLDAAAPEDSRALRPEGRPAAPEPRPAEAPRAGVGAYDRAVDAGFRGGAAAAAAAAVSAARRPAAPEVSIERDAALRTISTAAEKTVREALEASLSAEKLHPVVEAVVERVVWDVVPVLAERLIREAIEKLRSENPPA